MKFVFSIFLSLLLLTACQSYNPPSSKSKIDSVFVTAHVQNHGQHYPRVEQQVFSVDLLTKGLQFDSAFYISGTGYNLYLSDIFCSDTLLESGTYTIDTTAQAHTFLPGMSFDGSVTGCYLLQVSESAVADIILLTSGTMQVAYKGDSLLLDMELYSEKQKCYRALYRGLPL